MSALQNANGEKTKLFQPWLRALNLGISTSYGNRCGLRQVVDFFQRCRVNHTHCITNSVGHGSQPKPVPPSRPSIVWDTSRLVNVFMNESRVEPRIRSWVIRAWQTFRALVSRFVAGGPISRRNARLAVVALASVFAVGFREAGAELFDALDAYPPRWHLDTSDCNARVKEHENLPGGGVRGGCESMTFHADLGSEALLIYPIEPVRALDDLVANVSVMSAKSGAKIGLRVRFPYLRDNQTRRPVSVTVFGAQFSRPGRFQQIGVGKIERDLRIKMANLRGSFGSSSDLRDPYVDAIVINAYSGAGTTTIRIDELSLHGMIPVGDHGRVAPLSEKDSRLDPATSFGAGQESSQMLKMRLPSGGIAPSLVPAFPIDSVVRVLEHNGEPLSWVRSLGFDAVLLPDPPTAPLLKDAIRSRLLVYAPPPPAPDPTIQNLLEPVVAWYLGGGVALDSRRVTATDKTVRRLRTYPDLWQRPIVVAPTESWSEYSGIAEGVVSDLPPRVRNLSAAEQALELAVRHARMRGRTEVAVALGAGPPRRLVEMNRAIETSIGAPPQNLFRWHGLLAQTVQALEQSPRAIFFRSSDSLVSGTPASQQRSMALSYINRLVATVTPWLASARPASPFPVEAGAYRCGRVATDREELLLITSEIARGDEILPADGRFLDIELPPDRIHHVAWRLTDFAAERVPLEKTSTGCRLRIVSPDVAEIVVVGSDAALGARLNQSAARFAQKAASDRWQLASAQVRHTREAWQNAIRTGATFGDATSENSPPFELLNTASRIVAEAEPVYRAGDVDATLRLSRRADALGLRAGWRLTEALLPEVRLSGRSVSCPPIDGGRPFVQAAWRPLMEDEGWSENLLGSGGLDRASVLGPGGWTFGRRKMSRTASDLQWVSRGYFDGAGALKVAVASTIEESLGGGYEGTVSVLASPTVKVGPGQAIRIDAMVRTLGFGRPHQGVLVYDTIGGQELGKLIRGATEWTRVRLYRQSLGQSQVQVKFEIIGDGEAVVDEVAVKVWDPGPLPGLPLRAADVSIEDTRR